MKFDKLDALLAQTSTSTQAVSLFADMLSLPNDGRYPALDMTSEQRRQKTLEAFGSQMEALSRARPVLMILEDAHWTYLDKPGKPSAGSSTDFAVIVCC